MTMFRETSNWRAGMRDVSVAIDDTMGEPVTVTPVTPGAPNFPASPEPDKAVTVTAVFTSKAETVMLERGRVYSGHDINPLVSTSKPVFQFDYHALPWPLRQGYRIKLCRTGETFEVTDAKPDGVARITVNVVQLGRQSEAR